MSKVEIKVIKATKAGNRVTVVVESNLWSDQTFAVNPFYDEGPEKNQLQQLIFGIEVTERSGKLTVKANYGNCLSHFTKGHSQLHESLTRFYLSDKDLARDYILNRPQYINQHDKIIERWKSDKQFYTELKSLSEKVKGEARKKSIDEARSKLTEAMAEYEKILNPVESIGDGQDMKPVKVKEVENV